MKIGFVAEPYEASRASGMGYLILELLRNLLIDGSQHEFIIYSSVLIMPEHLPVACKNVLIPKSFLKKLIYFATLRDPIDALLFVAPLLPLLIPRRIKAVITCQELASQKITPKRFSDKIVAFVRDRVLMPRALSRARAIIAASQATKNDLMQFYRIPAERIEVIYDGYQDLKKYKNNAPAIEEHMKPYFFFTGRIKYRKNVHGIVAAFILFKKRMHTNHKLVIAGGQGGEYYGQLIQNLEQNNLKDEVFFVNYVSPELLYALYANAVAFVFPSFNEGFGMPILEAMSLGTPVITSNRSSMIEVAGGASLLVNPLDTESISSAMENITSNPGMRDQLIQKGYMRSVEFSWKRAAMEYIRLIESI